MVFALLWMDYSITMQGSICDQCSHKAWSNKYATLKPTSLLYHQPSMLLHHYCKWNTKILWSTVSQSLKLVSFVDRIHPFLDTTPSNHGNGMIELKSPLCYKDDNLTDGVDGQFYMAKIEHEQAVETWLCIHYYQIQLQMEICAVPHNDIVIWTK